MARRVLLCLLLVSLVVPIASAQTHVYAVKFVCGTRSDVKPIWDTVSPGRYWTAVNIFSYAGREKTAIKAHVATTAATPVPGTTVQIADVMVLARHATEVDCTDILAAKVDTRSGFLKGFLILESEFPLTITGVYTAANSAGVSSIDIETIARAEPLR